MQKTKVRKNSSRLLAVLLALIMLVGLLPTAALALGEIDILLSYFNMDDNGFPIARKTVRITPNLSEAYGYIDAYYGTAVTALDAIVAAHVEVYGNDRDTINDKLVVSSSGWITNFMDIGGNFVFFINGGMSGAGAGLVRLGGGDVVELFAMQDTYMSSDAYIWFELDGARVDKITVGTNQSVSLTLVGDDFAMWGDYSMPAGFDEDAEVFLMDVGTPPTATFDEKKDESDDYGNVEVTFDSEGTYYLSVNGVSDTYSPLMGPWLEVVVTNGGGPAAAVPVIVNDPPEPETPGEPTVDAATALSETLSYIAATQAPSPIYGHEWEILTLARGGYGVSEGYYEGYYASVASALDSQQTNKPSEPGGGANQPSTNARLVLALTAIGVDARDVGGYNLLEPLTDLIYVSGQGVNAAAYALLAMDSKPYAVDPTTKNNLIAYIISKELTGGGFNWGFDTNPDPDMTGIVLQALAPYKARLDVEPVITRALVALSSMQKYCGGYESWGAVNAESGAQVITAAAALGMNPVEDFIKDKAAVDAGYDGAGNDNPLYSMLRFYMTGGGFQASWALGAVSEMTTQQAGYALVAYDRFYNGDNSLYDMSDCDITLSTWTGVDRSVLDALVSSADLMLANAELQALYTSASWSLMAAKLDEAKAALNAPEATQAQIQQAAANLNSAINGLTLLGGQDPGGIAVTFSLIGDDGTWINPIEYSFPESPVTVYMLIIRALNDAGLAQEGAESGYVSGIQSSEGEWLREFDKGVGSGWIFSVGGVYPNRGINDYVLSDGDTVVLRYTVDYTSEPDLDSGSDGGGGAAPETPPATAEVKPEVTVDDSGKASSEIKTDDVKNALDEIKKGLEENSDTKGELKITAKPETGASTVDVKFSAEAAKAVADAGVQLTIDTGVSTVTFDAEAIKAATGGAEGALEVVLTTELVSKDTLSDEQRELVGDSPVFDLTLMVGGNNISDFGTGTVTVTLPYTPKADEDTSNLTVYYLRDDGTIVEMKGAKYDPESGGIIFTTNHFSKFFVGIASAWANPFDDVKEADWFFDAVRYAYENGLMNGTGGDVFSPNNPMTRAMLVTVLYRYEGEPAVTAANPFSDVSNGQWYTNAIIWASEKGIVEGLGDGLFGTNNDITREQIATILYRYAENKGLNIEKTTDLSAYTDVSLISSWAQSAMVWANAEGLITGRTETTLAPQETAKRAEVAMILMRYIQEFVN